MSKIEELRSEVNDLSVSTPETNNSSVFWHIPDRNDRHYFRLTPMDEDADQDLYYDVWVETDISTDKAGYYSFTVEVVLFDGRLNARLEERNIVNLSFTMDEVSRIQNALNNWRGTYKQKIRNTVDDYAGMAESMLLEDLPNNE